MSTLFLLYCFLIFLQIQFILLKIINQIRTSIFVERFYMLYNLTCSSKKKQRLHLVLWFCAYRKVIFIIKHDLIFFYMIINKCNNNNKGRIQSIKRWVPISPPLGVFVYLIRILSFFIRNLYQILCKKHVGFQFNFNCNPASAQRCFNVHLTFMAYKKS